jgi:ABC-2 type transport system permease protein
MNVRAVGTGPRDIRSAGYEIKGPSALAGDWRRFWALTFTIARNEFKLKFFGSALGYLWQLMRPLMLFGVLYVVFSTLVKVGANVPHFPVVLLSGIVMFTFFAEATGASVRSVVERENLVRKVQFPRLVIPAAVVMTAFFNLCLNLVAVAVFMLASGVGPKLTWLELPLILAVVVVFACGVAMLLSALFVRYRDMAPIWDVISQVMFYISPVIYPIERVLEKRSSVFGIPVHRLYFVNPLSEILVQFRHAMIDNNAPAATSVIGGFPEVLIPAGIIALLFVLGFRVFNRSAPLIAENL